MRQARFRADDQSSMRTVSTGTSCTLRSPASISTKRVLVALSVRNNDVLPTPNGPIMRALTPRFSQSLVCCDDHVGFFPGGGGSSRENAAAPNFVLLRAPEPASRRRSDQDR